MSARIPLASPEILAEDVDAVVEVLRGTRLSRGPWERRFEERLAAVVGTRHGIAVNSGTSGLHLALRARGIGSGDEVILPTYGFMAPANALLYEGAVPVFGDCDPVTLNLDPAAVDAAVTSRTRALLPVHVYGRPAAMDELCRIAERHDLLVLEDACEALGSQLGGRRAGALGDVGVLSFYPNKQVTAGEGGMVMTDDDALACRLRALRNQGRWSAADGLDQQEVGFSYRLSELNCALGASQAVRVEAAVARRRALARAYDERLGECELLRVPPLDCPGGRISWFAYAVRLAPGLGRDDRDAILAALGAAGIECGRYFQPIHLQPLFRDRFGHRDGEFPVAEAAGERVLALPFYHGLEERRIDRVCECLESELERRWRRRSRSRDTVG